MNRSTATLRYLRMPPRKVRLVAGLLRGLPVNEAEAQLLHQRKRAAKPLLKLLRSAVANAKNNQRLNPEKLVVEALRVDQGPMLKRYLPRARGSASPIQKKMSHVTLTLVELDKATARFTIVEKKKTKLPPKERPKKGKEKASKDEAVAPAKPKTPGFFKKMFSRKTGMGK